MSHRLVTWCAWLGLVLALIAGPGRARAEDNWAEMLVADAGRARPTMAGSRSIDAQDYVDGIDSRRLVAPRGSSGRARGELGVAGGGALDGGGLAGELHLGLGLIAGERLELGVDARLSLRAHDRATFSMLVTVARWLIVGDLGLRFAGGGSSDGDDLGAAWRAELTLPLRRFASPRAIPIATFGIGGTTAGEDHTDVGLGLGLKF